MGRRGLQGVLAALLVVALPLLAVAPAAAAPGTRIVYLTFDDGPNVSNTPGLLRLLYRERVPATFFVLGQSLALDPAYATRLWLSGHAVGNHSWSHPDLTRLSLPAIRYQLGATQALEGPVGGACLRPPYGAVNTAVETVAAELGLTQVRWTIDPKDWAHQDARYIAEYVLSRVDDRSIILLHDGGGPRTQTIAAVGAMIPQLRERGFEFRAIPACRVPPLSGVLSRMIDRAGPSPSKARPAADQGQRVALRGAPAGMSR